MSKFFYTTVAFFGLILQLSGLQASEIYELGVDVHGEPLVYGREYEIHVFGGPYSPENRLRLFVSSDIKDGDNVVEAHSSKEERNIFTIEKVLDGHNDGYFVHIKNKTTGKFLFSSANKRNDVLKVVARTLVQAASIKIGEEIVNAITKQFNLESGPFPTFYVEAHDDSNEKRNDLKIISVIPGDGGREPRNVIKMTEYNFGKGPYTMGCYLFLSATEKMNNDLLLLSCYSLGQSGNFPGYPEFIFVPVN